MSRVGYGLRACHALLAAFALLALLALLAPFAVAAQDDPLDDLGDEEGAGEDAAEEDAAPQDSEQEAASEDVAEDDTASEDVAAEDEPEPAAGEPATRAITLHAGLGMGLGTVSFERPTAFGAQVLEQTAFAAADVLVRVRAWPDESFALETLLAYQSSLGLRLQLPPLFGLPPTVTARVQRGELSVAPVLRLGGREGTLAIALPVGFGFQSLVSEVHQFGMPQYVVGGPQLRAELHVELGEIAQLRIGPEVQWILVLASSLRDEDACCQGVAFGAQASIEASLGAHLALALAYRQLTSNVSAPGTAFEDVQRFVTARIAGGF